jgi:anaerobic selenocysteine-containing dehydrogenase
MARWMQEVTPEKEAIALQTDNQYPMILMAERHTSTNDNTIMLNPAWNEGKRACTLALNPLDGEKLGLSDGSMALFTTESGNNP